MELRSGETEMPPYDNRQRLVLLLVLVSGLLCASNVSALEFAPRSDSGDVALSVSAHAGNVASGACSMLREEPDKVPYDVSVIEAVGVPPGFAVPWLLPPRETFLPGILVADLSLVKRLEAAGVRIRVLQKYVESRSYYLVEGSPLVSEATLSRTAELIWSSRDTHLISSEEELGVNLRLLGFEVRLVRPLQRSPGSRARVESAPPRGYSSTERYWINRMVSEVSEGTLLDYLNSLTGEKAVNLAGGPDTLLTRYSYSQGCRGAAEYIYEKLDSMGLIVTYDYYFGMVLRTVAFMGDEGYVAGSAGTIYHTEDGGNTWVKQNWRNHVTLWKSSFIAPDSGWISGARGAVLRTFDGGSTWDSLCTGTQNFLYGVKFLNSFVGWVCGGNGTVLKTVDGGVTWSSQQSGTRQYLQDIEFVDTRNGWAVGEYGEIIHTADGGEHWSRQTSGVESRPYDVCFVDSLKGWVVGSGGMIIRTIDGGSSWETLVSGVTSFLYGLCFTDSLHGWVVGDEGLVLSTQDGGVHWNVRVRQGAGTPSLFGVSFVGNLRGWAVGYCLLNRTDDGGASWLPLTKNVPDKWENVVATIHGTSTPSRSYIVCGHFDSISPEAMTKAPGADDNASGTSVVLEAARILGSFPFLSSVKFICFSGEEQWLLGSYHYAHGASLAGEDIAAVLNLDMVGYGSPPLMLHANSASEWIADHCLAVRDSFVNWLDLLKASMPSGAGDHASFTYEGYSAIAVMDRYMRQNPYYHTVDDTVGTLTISMITDAARLAVAVIASLAGLDTLRLPRPPGPPDVPKMALGRNYPNPFSSSTHIPFALPAMKAPARYRVAVFDPVGRMVKILEEGHTGDISVQKEVAWDGTDWGGERVASGVYICSLRCGGESRIRKIVLMR